MSCQNTFCQDRVDDLLRENDQLRSDLDEAILARDQVLDENDRLHRTIKGFLGRHADVIPVRKEARG